MIERNTRTWLEQVLDSKITVVDYISQSEHNQCLQIRRASDDQLFFLKIILGTNKTLRVQTEVQGLKEIDSSKAIRTPKRIAQEANKGYLLLEWIERSIPNLESQRQFGQDLARMHHCQQKQFGFRTDNFIAHLEQQNTAYDNWARFYMEQRIEPQIKYLIDADIIPSQYHTKLDILYKQIEENCPKEPASLLHGDLWGGNFMINNAGNAYIFDPAVYYGHREMDIAMSLLFGSFGRPFYEGYQAQYPMEAGFNTRVSLYQIYPLMIHARLFGGFYIRQCTDVLNRWTQT